MIGVNGWRSHQLNLRISGCENALVEQVTNLAKEQGIRACAQGQWSEAIAQFEAALQEERNDPETRIHINNARILASGSAYDTVVASIPIGSNLNVAQEMLRGVAQAQTEFNGQDNGSRKLRVLIANDDNDTVLAKRLARQFAKNKDILAVIGHNATNASMAGAEIYNARQLPMLTPTSFAGDLDMYDAGKKYPFAFRMVPNMLTVSQLLSAHIVKQGYQKVAVCVDNSAEDNASFGNDFKKVADDSFEILDIPCDLGMAGFSAEEAIAAILDAGADAMVLAPHIDRLEKGLALARSNSGQTKPLALYGSPSFYTQVTLEQGQSAVEGMVIPSLWNPDNLFKQHPFLLDANRLWGGPVNWRTAMSYDATQIIAQGLQRVGRSQHEGAITNLQFDPQAHATNSSTKHSNTKQLRRRALQQQLSESDFSHNGVTGFVQFRKPKPKERTIGLLKIHPTPDAETQYKFRLLPQKKD